MSRVPHAMRRALWVVARALGARRWVWDDQYRLGYWNPDFQTKSPKTLELVERHTAGGRLVELGCGTGALAAMLPKGTFSSYLGLDVSKVAVERGRSRRVPNTDFVVAAIENWQGDADVSCVLFEESLYYLSAADQRAVMARAFDSLAPEGVAIVIAHDFEKHASTLSVVRESGRVAAEQMEGRRCYLVMAPLDRKASVNANA